MNLSLICEPANEEFSPRTLATMPGHALINRARCWVKGGNPPGAFRDDFIWLAMPLPTDSALSGLSPRLNLKRSGEAFLVPLSTPLGSVFDPPVDLCQFKSDVVPHFLGLVPFVPQNLFLLSLEFPVEQRLPYQIICRARCPWFT